MPDFIDPAIFAEFDNCTVTILAPGATTVGPRGERLPGAPTVILDNEPAQEWELDEHDKAGLTGEEIQLRLKVRLGAYHPQLTEKMTCRLTTPRGTTNTNILVAGHDGSRCVSILTLRRVTG